MSNNIPAIRPTQFEQDSIGRLTKSVNMSRGDINLLKTLVTLPGRPGDATLAVSVNIQCESNVFQQAVQWNLDAPTSILGLGWSMPGNRITLQTNKSLAPASLNYVAEIDGVQNTLIRDDVPWLRATLRSAAANAIVTGTIPPVVVSAFAAQGIALSSTSTAASGSIGWLITDPDFEHVFTVVATETGANVFDGGLSFQLQDYQFWRITYYQSFERWEITTEACEVRVFGGNVSQNANNFNQSSGNSIAWAVKWGGPSGNILGPSQGISTQTQYARQWNLSSRSDRWGSTVQYGYNEFPRDADGLLGCNAEQQVGTGGLPYTKAVYLTSITDIFGRTITFQYVYKTFTTIAQEYMDPHKALEPATQPETPPSNLGAPNAYQDQYDTLYLSSLTVANENAQHLYSLNFTYSFPTAVSSLSGPLTTTAAKRYLLSISEENAYGHTAPCYSFQYCTDAQNGPNLGAISQATYPQGGHAAWTYQTSNLEACDRSITINAPSSLGVNATPFTPFVYYGEDFVVNIWVSQNQSTVTLDVYTWIGSWVHWSADAPIYQNDSITIDRTTMQADVNDVSFGVAFATSDGNTQVFLVSRNPSMPTQWALESSHVTIGGNSVVLTGGSNFIVATSNSSVGMNSLYVFTWNWMTGEWTGTGGPLSTPTNPIFAIAQNEYYATATVETSQTTVAISWVDSQSNWHTGSSVELSSTPGYNVDRSIVWSSSASSAAMTFAEDPYGNSYTVELLTWDAAYNITAQGFAGLAGEGIDFGKIIWPPQSVIVSPTFVGVRQNIFRYDNGTWQWQSFDAAKDDAPNAWLDFAYGEDVVVQVFNDGSDAITTLISYDPVAAQFQSFSIKTTLPPTDNINLVGRPTISGDYLIARNSLFFRGASTDWSTSISAPVASLPASLGNLTADSLAFVNSGPNYLAYLYSDSDASQNTVQLLVLQNGGILSPPPAPLLTTTYTAPAHSDAGEMPIGPGVFATYPANAESFSTAQTFTLYRYAGQALSGPVTTYPVQLLTIGDGFGAVYQTAYEFDSTTAACDPSGSVVNYLRSASYDGVADPAQSVFGRTVYSYQNGYAFGSQYSMLNGLLTQTAVFSGSMLFTTQWQASFELSENVMQQPLSPSLMEAFNAGGVELSSSATIQYVQIDGYYDYWAVADGSSIYNIDSTRSASGVGDIRIFSGRPVQSVTTTWTVFTTRGPETLHGGYARPLQTIARKQHVPFTTVYTYNKFNGLPVTKSWAFFNAAGIKEEHTETTTFGETVYPAMRAANLLTPVVGLKHSVTATGKTTTTSSSATTWQGWQQASGPQLLLQAPSRNWSWTGDPSGMDTGNFPFSGPPDPSLWKLMSTVTSMSDAGLVLESDDASGVTHATLYDTAGQVPVSSCSNASFAGGQVLYAGFESYEDQTAWALSSGAGIVSTDAHTGVASLSLPPDASATVSALTPDGVRTCIFSAWYQTPANYVNESNSGWTITSQSSDVISLPFEPTNGIWTYQSVAMPPSSSIILSAANTGTGTVLIDDVTFVPLAAEFSARVYDLEFHLPSARLDECGHTWRTFRDSSMREIGGTSAADIPSALQLNYLSLTGNPSGFSATDPNAVIGVKAFLGGSYQNLSDWVVNPAGAVSASGRVFAHTDTSTSATITSALKGSSEFALYFETLPLSPGALTLKDDFSLTVGAMVLTLSASTGQWNVGTGSFIGPLSSCLVLQTGGQLIFWANGKLMFSAVSESIVRPSITTGKNAIGISNLILLQSPALRVKYSDATGAERQDHLFTAEGYFVNQVIRDARSKVIVTTKAAPGLFGPGASAPIAAYRAGFVDVPTFLNNLNASGTMTGDIADWFNGTNDTNDAGYPYTRNVLESSPLVRPIEKGFPGAEQAIVDFGTTSPESRQTIQLQYGSNTCVSVPYLNLPAGSYGITTQITQLKIETNRISDAAAAEFARFTAISDTNSLTATDAVYSNGEQTVAVMQPNSYASGGTMESEIQTQNGLKQITADTSPDAGASQYMYDGGGRIRFAQDASAANDGYLVYFRWDALGRMLSRGVATFDWTPTNSPQLREFANNGVWPENQSDIPFTQQRTWNWDGDGTDASSIGHLVRSTAVTGSTTVTQEMLWNGAGLLKSKQISVSNNETTSRHEISFKYDVQGRLISVKYPDVARTGFESVHYKYDGRDNILSICDENEIPFVTYAYNASGSVKDIRYASGFVSGTQVYDSPGRRTSLQLKSASGAFASTLEYDVDGMIGSLTETLTPTVTSFDASVQYGYDTLGRLESATDANTARSVLLSYRTPSGVIDLNGNIQSIKAGSDATVRLNYTEGTNQVQSQQSDMDTQTYSYYANGALKQRGPHLNISYLPGGLLPSLVTAGGTSISFAYDAEGNRVTKQVGSDAASVNVYAGFAGPIMSVDSDGIVTALIYGPQGLTTLSRNGIRYSVVSDYLGTPRVAFDDSGKVIAAYAYNAYGALVASQEPVAGFIPIGFTGQQFDRESGLYNFRSRLYDPQKGRFLAPDPASQFPSGYCYVGNLPTMLTDQSGQMSAWGEAALDTLFAVILVAAVVGTAGAAAAAIPAFATVSTLTDVLAVGGAQLAIGAVGGAVSNAAFQGLWYGIKTPPGDWNSNEFGKEVGAAAISGAAGGAVAGGLSGIAAGASLPVVELTDGALSEEIQAIQDAADLPEAAAKPDSAEGPAARAWKWKELAVPAIREGIFGGIGGGLRGYVQAGLTNVFNDRSFNDDVLAYTLRNAATGFLFGAIGGAFGAANDGGQYTGRVMSSIKSGFSKEPLWFAVAGTGGPLLLGTTISLFFARTSNLQPYSGNNNQQS